MKSLQVTALIVLAALLVACNTVEGFGTDMKQAGNAIENTADKAKN